MLMGLIACSPAGWTEPPPVPVTVQLLWTHNAQFAGFYAADRLGYYAEEGLQVTLVEGGPDIDYLAPVLSGEAQFGVAGAGELLAARAEGRPLRAVATIYRRSPLALVSLAGSGITRPQDFIGKKIWVTPQADTQFQAMMRRVGIPPDQYTPVKERPETELLASGEIPVWSVYINNLGVTLQQAGYELNFIYPDDYGVHFYADSIFSSDAYLAENRDTALRFLRATLEGWTYAVENRAQVGRLVQHFAPQADPALEVAKMEAALPLINTGDGFIGWMKPQIWEGMHAMLYEQGVLKQPFDVSQVYTLEFLTSIYRGEP